MTDVWVMMRMRPETPDRWDVQGVYSSRAFARAACTTPHDIIFTLRLNETLPDEDVPMREMEVPCADGAVVTWIDRVTGAVPAGYEVVINGL